jgi:hypothetical protein
MTEILRLRMLTITGTCCLATYFCCQPEPMFPVVAWNLFLVSLNLLQIVRLLLARKAKRREGADAIADSRARPWRGAGTSLPVVNGF